MTFLHFRYRLRLGLVASSSLPAREAEEVLEHTANCPSCRVEFEALSKLASGLRADAALDRPLPISTKALRRRVLAAIHAEAARPSGASWSLKPALAAMTIVGAGLLGGLALSRFAPPSNEATASLSLSDTALNDAAFYERLEKTHTRAKAARYLAEAQDILIQVRAASDCPDSPPDSPGDTVDVEKEAQTSRSLLKRRAALVSGSEGTLVAAQGVMEEVEGVLQQVAELPRCTRRKDVDAIARSVDRRNLLMKIDLVAQELAAS